MMMNRREVIAIGAAATATLLVPHARSELSAKEAEVDRLCRENNLALGRLKQHGLEIFKKDRCTWFRAKGYLVGSTDLYEAGTRTEDVARYLQARVNVLHALERRVLTEKGPREELVAPGDWLGKKGMYALTAGASWVVERV